MHVRLIWRQFAPGWEFHPGQDRRDEFPRGRVLVVNTVKGLTIHKVEFNPGRNSPRGEILVVSRSLKCNDQTYCKVLTNSATSVIEVYGWWIGNFWRKVWINFSTHLFSEICGQMLWQVLSPFCRMWTKRGKALSKKRTFWKCGKYHSFIQAINSHKRACEECEDESDDEESRKNEDEDEENKGGHIEVEFIGDEKVYEGICL